MSKISTPKKRWKKWFKIIFISFFSFFVVITLIIATLLNFIFTPEKITPQLVEIANQNINGKFYCKSAELTFFSSFPNFGVAINDGKITVSNDTLLLFNSCKAEFNVAKLLQKNVIDIMNIALENAYANVLIDKKGILNWDILKTDTLSDKSSSDFNITNLKLKKMRLSKVRFKYANEMTHDLFSIDSLSANFKMSYDKENITAKLDADIKKIKFIKEGFVFLENSHAGFDTEVNLFRKQHKLVFKKGGISVNGVDLLTTGYLQRDTLSNKIEADLTLKLKVPNLKSVLELIPERIVQREKINMKGEVDFFTTVKGFYGKGEYPLTEIKASIKKGQFQYVEFPGSINHIECDFTSRIYFKNKKKSHLTFSSFDIRGFGIGLSGNFIVKDLLVSPYLNSKLKGNIDINKLHKVFPFNPNITAEGKLETDLIIAFNINELKDKNINSLQLNGNIKLEDIAIAIPKDTLNFKIKHLDFKTIFEHKDAVKGLLTAKGLLLERTPKRFAKIDDFQSKFQLDRKNNNSVLALTINAGDATIKQDKKFIAQLKGAQISVFLKGNQFNRKNTIINSDFSLDSLGIYYKKRFAGITKGKYKIKLEQDSLNNWLPQGNVKFEKMTAYSLTIGVPVRIENTGISLRNNSLKLRNAKFSLGKSDIVLTGSIENIKSLVHEGLKENIIARLSLNAENIDANELMAIFSKVSEKAKEIEKTPEELVKETMPVIKGVGKVFDIPKNIDFIFDTHIKKLRFKTMDMENIHGNLLVKNGKLELSEMRFNTLAADLSASVRYSPTTEKEADIQFDLNLSKVEMARISEMLPVLDSLFPMTKSFEGLVDFRIKGLSKIDQDMSLKTQTLKGIAALKASDIMIFDSATFKEIADMMMFKSKKKNPIESLNLEMIISNNQLELLPSYLAIDRYELAVGGIQKIDMSYDYHISVLKSPVPFKLGVDITGHNLDDYKIKLSKAKLKYYFTDSERLQKKADSSVIKKKEAILKRLNFK